MMQQEDEIWIESKFLGFQFIWRFLIQQQPNKIILYEGYAENLFHAS